MTIDLLDHVERLKLQRLIAADVEVYSREALTEEPRTHLGASEIGDNCSAKLWGNFRWLKREDHSGRMLRLFKRGHYEEPHFISWLRGIGFDVREHDAEGKQFRIIGVNGHFGGSCDGMAMPPARYGLPGPLLLEFKTHNAKSFAKLAGKQDLTTGIRSNGEGVRVSKPKHYSQMCAYGRGFGLEFGLYVAGNKDNDELYFEIVPLDWRHADDLFRKAEAVISSQEQPAKISMVATYFECKYCHLSPICFKGEKPEKNCRSCKFAVPVENGQWNCSYLDMSYILNEVEIKIGCVNYEPIINA